MAFVNKGEVMLFMSEAGKFDEAAVAKATSKRKSKLKTASKMSSLPL